LQYAVQDAEAIEKAFRAQEGRLFRRVNTVLITDRAELKPTRENIVNQMESFLRQASQNDLLVLFVAGHGTVDAAGKFFLLPNDAAYDSQGGLVRSRVVSGADLRDMLDLPGKKLLLLDTCHSASVSGTRGPDADRLVRELAELKAIILTSSTGTETSQESEAWQHGVFTYALLEGLSGKADTVEKDRVVSMKELDAYVSEMVPKLTKGAQHPITDSPKGGYPNFPIAVVR